MTEYAPTTIKRIVVTICENPGVTVGQIAAACNLDHDRCLEVLLERGTALGLERDVRNKRFYPKGCYGLGRRTKAEKTKFNELCQKCLDSLPEKLGKIAEEQAKEKRTREAYTKEKARQIQARKISWELEQERRAAILLEDRRERERQRLAREQEEQRLRRAREEESFRRQKLQSIKVMDTDALSEEITAVGFTSQPEEVQEALTTQLLDRLESNEQKPVKHKKIYRPTAPKIDNWRIASFVFVVGTPALIAWMAFVWSDAPKQFRRPNRHLNHPSYVSPEMRQKQAEEKAAREVERERKAREREAAYQAKREARSRAGNAMRAAGYWLGPGGGCLTWNSKGDKKYVSRNTCKRFFRAEGVEL